MFAPQVTDALRRELRAPKAVLTRSTLGGIKGLQGDTVGAVYMDVPSLGKKYLGVSPHCIENELQPSSIAFFMLDITDVNSIKVMRPHAPARVQCSNTVQFHYDGSSSYVQYLAGYGLYNHSVFNAYMPHAQWQKCSPEYYQVKLDFTPTPSIDLTSEMKVEWKELAQFIKGWLPSDGVTPFRIFILGRSRIGKSSLLNSLVSALEGELVSIEKVVDGANRGTEHYYNQQLQRINKLIQFATNEGFESNSANFEYIERVVRIFDGSEVVGSHMSNNGDGGLVPEYARIPMGAIIHVLCESPDQTDFQIASEINKVLNKKRGFVPEDQSFYAMTKIDTLQVDGASTLSQYIESTVVQSKLTAIKTGMGCQTKNNIFPVVSIGSWMEKTNSAKIDPHSAVLVLRMLKRILVQANYTLKTATSSGTSGPGAGGPGTGGPGAGGPSTGGSGTGGTGGSGTGGLGAGPGTGGPGAGGPSTGGSGTGGTGTGGTGTGGSGTGGLGAGPGTGGLGTGGPGPQKFTVEFTGNGAKETFGIRHECKNSEEGLDELKLKISTFIKKNFADVPCSGVGRLVVEQAGKRVTLSDDEIAAGTVIVAVLMA